VLKALRREAGVKDFAFILKARVLMQKEGDSDARPPSRPVRFAPAPFFKIGIRDKYEAAAQELWERLCSDEKRPRAFTTTTPLLNGSVMETWYHRPLHE
jgi:hypothetical protein